MYRKWKNTAALGMAVLLGCMMPMSTMLAAEDGVEIEAGSVSDNDVSYEAGDASGNENTSNEEDVPADVDAGLAQENGTLSAAGMEPNVALKTAGTSESTDAPEIAITRDGKDCTCKLGGKINFEYIGYWGPQFEVSTGPGSNNVSVYYCLDRVTDTEAEAKAEADMGSLGWTLKESPSETVLLSQDGKYVIYVKVEAGDQEYYARSEGTVVDTVSPVIKGIEEGKSYAEGTLFQVEDANLDCVMVNEQQVQPEDGNYKVAANGTSCLIRAKDKAGHETTCSITVSGNVSPEPEEPGPEKPKPEEPGPEEPRPEEPGMPETDHLISESGEYALKAGEKYHLAEGKWKVGGDKSVYQGGRDFYVTVDGSYQFTK